MRKIRFRAKRETTREWVYGFYVHNPVMDEHKIITYVVNNLLGMVNNIYGNDNSKPLIQQTYIVLASTVGQYTGLKDINGIAIYEDDIVANFNFDDPYFRARVVCVNGSFGYVSTSDAFVSFAENRHFHWVNGRSDRIIVVDNIYEIHGTGELL